MTESYEKWDEYICVECEPAGHAQPFRLLVPWGDSDDEYVVPDTCPQCDSHPSLMIVCTREVRKGGLPVS